MGEEYEFLSEEVRKAMVDDDEDIARDTIKWYTKMRFHTDDVHLLKIYRLKVHPDKFEAEESQVWIVLLNLLIAFLDPNKETDLDWRKTLCEQAALVERKALPLHCMLTKNELVVLEAEQTLADYRASQSAATEADQEAPKEAVQEAPKEAVQEAPKEAVQEAPKEAVQEAPKEADQEVPKEADQEASPHDSSESLARKKELVMSTPCVVCGKENETISRVLPAKIKGWKELEKFLWAHKSCGNPFIVPKGDKEGICIWEYYVVANQRKRKASQITPLPGTNFTEDGETLCDELQGTYFRHMDTLKALNPVGRRRLPKGAWKRYSNKKKVDPEN